MPASSVSVTFPGYGTREESPRGLRVVQEEYRHDVAIYSVPTSRKSYGHSTGTPVKITWASGRGSSAFTGYVHHIEPSSSGTTTVWCRGASHVLDDGVQTTWRYRTVPAVVAEVSRTFNFDITAEPHGRVFETIVATGGPLWRTLVQYAQDIGYSFYATNTRLMIHQRLYNVRRYASEAPVLRSAPSRPEHSLLEFHPQDGHAPVGRRRANRVVQGIDRRTGHRFRVVGGVMPGELGRTMTLPNGTSYEEIGTSTPEEARWVLAAEAENERFNLIATAKAVGNARVHQTWPVIIAGTGASYEGLWFVRKVTHNITDPTYTMDLELGKDARGSSITIPEERARRVVDTRGNPQGRPKAVMPPTVLVNGRWQSQWSAASRTFRGA